MALHFLSNLLPIIFFRLLHQFEQVDHLSSREEVSRLHSLIALQVGIRSTIQKLLANFLVLQVRSPEQRCLPFLVLLVQ